MKCPICDEETGIEIGGEPFCIFCESQSPRERNRIGNYPTCDECGEQHGESDCTETPMGGMPWCERCQCYHHETAEHIPTPDERGAVRDAISQEIGKAADAMNEMHVRRFTRRLRNPAYDGPMGIFTDFEGCDSGIDTTPTGETIDITPVGCQPIPTIKERAKSFVDDNFSNPTPSDYRIIETAMVIGASIAYETMSR